MSVNPYRVRDWQRDLKLEEAGREWRETQKRIGSVGIEHLLNRNHTQGILIALTYHMQTRGRLSWWRRIQYDRKLIETL